MTLIQKLRYMGRQYAAGQASRGGRAEKHYLEEAADEMERLQRDAARWTAIRDFYALNYDDEDVAGPWDVLGDVMMQHDDATPGELRGHLDYTIDGWRATLKPAPADQDPG